MPTPQGVRDEIFRKINMTTELPPILKKELGSLYAESVYGEGMKRAFEILCKASWHSKEDCPSENNVIKDMKEAGWRSPDDVEKMVKLWDERFEKARQQQKKKLYGLLLHSKGYGKFTSQNEITCQEIVDEVFK